MAYRIESPHGVEREVRRIALEQLEKAMAELQGPGGRHAKIHRVRKRLKKLRGLVRLMRPAAPDLYERENRIFRDAGRRVSDARDATAFLETYDRLTAHYEGQIDLRQFGPIRAALTRRRSELVREQDVDDRIASVRETLEESFDRVAGWSLDSGGWAAVRGGLRKTYGRARGRSRRAWKDASAEAFHQWRKRAKYHRYHMKLLRNLWDPVVGQRRSQVHVLTDLLGADHDFAELRRVLHEESDRFEDLSAVSALVALMDRRRGELHAEARPLGERCFAEKPKRFVKRFGRYWAAWRRTEEGPPPEHPVAAPLGPVDALTAPGAAVRALHTLAAVAVLIATGCGAPGGESPEDRDTPAPLRLVTWNIKHGEGMDGVVDLDRIAVVLAGLHADVIALQEVDDRTERTGGIDQARAIADRLGYRAVHGPHRPYQGGWYGNAVLTRLPIRATRVHPVPSADGSDLAVLEVEVDAPGVGPFSVVSVHLAGSVEERTSQADAVDALFADTNRPVVLTGDFNGRPDDPAVRRIAASWRLATKSGAAFTYPSDAPDREIDYVALGGAAGLRVVEHHVVDEPLAADHRPLVAILELQR